MEAVMIPYSQDITDDANGHPVQLSVKTAIIYVPGELLIKRAKDGGFDADLIESMYSVYVGKAADKEYGELIKGCKEGQKPKSIEVSNDIVAWAKAVYEARNPPKEIVDFLSGLGSR